MNRINENKKNSNNSPIMTITEVCEFTTLKTSTIYAWSSCGKFPKQLRLSAGRTAWVRAEVIQWVAAKIANR